MAKRLFGIIGAGVLLAAGVVLGQSPVANQAAKVEFEVASVKLAQPLASQMAAGKLHVGMQIDGARVDIGSLSPTDLIAVAFKVKQYQVSGPAWMSEQRFDIMGKMLEGASKEQVGEMLQALLADRFKLTFHRENKDHSVYALGSGKGWTEVERSCARTRRPGWPR